MSNCDLCDKQVDERSMQEQQGYWLCLACSGSYSDAELAEKMKGNDDD
tara:strand:+ start:701 stop:844 length:144 start_codon:yes stop_codon:yes gene_type:complete